MTNFLEGDYRALVGGDNANNRASTSSVVGNRDGSMLERLEDLAEIEERVSVSTAQLLVTGTTIFTVVGSPIFLVELVSLCMVGSDSTAATLQWSADGTVGAATVFTAASASRANQAAGDMIVCNFTALSTAPDLVTAGVGLASVKTRGVIVPAGIITTTVGSGPTTTATYIHYLRFKPLGTGCSVTAS